MSNSYKGHQQHSVECKLESIFLNRLIAKHIIRGMREGFRPEKVVYLKGRKIALKKVIQEMGRFNKLCPY